MIGRWLPAVVAGVLVLVGCATLPTSGPVRQGEPGRYDAGDSFVRVLPPPPRGGAEPAEIVRGFLLASANSDNGHAPARLFLHPEAGDRWRPEVGVTVFDGNPPTLLTEGDRVIVQARQVAAIDAEGHYRQLPAARRVSVVFTVRPDPGSGGEHRIAALPDGLHLPRYEVLRAFRGVNLYFLTPDQARVVPDPLLLPAGPGLATTLVSRLLAGPTGALRATAGTAFPRGTGLAVSSVPVANGVASVDLGAAVLQAAPEARRALSAQLARTLRQVPTVRALRISAVGTPLAVPDAEQPQPIDAWSSYDPDILAPGARAHVVVGGRVGVLEGGSFVPLPGPAGTGRPALRGPAVSPDGQRIAALSVDSRGLYAGRVGVGDPMPRRLTGTALRTPSYDMTGTLWVVDRPVRRPGVPGTGRGVLWALPAEGRAIRVTLPLPAGASVTLIRVARDGTRIAYLASRGRRSQLHVGVVVRGAGQVRVVSPRRLAPELVEIADVAWQDADRVAVLGSPAGGVRTPYLVAISGLDVDGLSTLPEPVTVAAAPGGAALLLGTRAGVVYEASGRTWTRRGTGLDPAYPG